MSKKTGKLKIIPFVFFLFLFFTQICYPQVDFTKHMIDSYFRGACALYATDINRDSLTDVLGSAFGENSIAWWENSGTVPISWTKNIISNTFHAASYVHAADVNNDGIIDVLGSAWLGNEIAWWKNSGGTPIIWTKQTIDSTFNHAHEVYAADVDGDGDMDVLGAAAQINEIAWWENDGGNPINWTKHVIDGNFYGARSVYAAYIDGDTLIDVVGAAFTSNDIKWWRNNGDSTWTAQMIDGYFYGAHKVYACDINGDSITDVLGAAYTAADITWWYNDGNTPIQWTKQLIDGSFNGALSVYADDIDGDNDVDIMGTAETNGVLALWYNDGNFPITWSKQKLDSNLTGAWPVFSSDINRDGDVDVLGGSSYLNYIAWWENEGSVGVSNNTSFVSRFKLMQNYPNPFNPKTVINYQLPVVSDVKLIIYDIAGREVATLVNEKLSAGIYKVDWKGKGYPSGLYFYKLIAIPYNRQAVEYINVKKMLLLK